MGGGLFFPLLSTPLLDFKSLAWIQSLADVVFFITCFLFFPSFFPRLAFLFFLSFYCPPLISSSPFPLHSFLFFHLFPFIFFLFYFLSAAFLFLVPPFPNFFLLFISSLFLILFVFSFSPLNFFLVLPLYQGGCYEHKG